MRARSPVLALSSALAVGAASLAACASADVKPAPGRSPSSARTPRAERGPPPRLVGEAVTADVNGDGFADLIVGLPGRDEPARNRPGRVLVWLGGKGGLRARPSSVIVEPEVGQGNLVGSFGEALLAVGDVNRDGFADIVVAAPETGSCIAPPGAKLPPRQGGRAYLLLGARAGLTAAPAAVVDGDRMGGRLGATFHGAGDVDGDGTPEIVITEGGGGSEICWERSPGIPAMLPPPVSSGARGFHCGPTGFSPWPAGDTRALALNQDEQSAPPRLWQHVTADFDRDGHADLLSSAGVPGAMVHAGALGIGDVNGDVVPDLATGHSEFSRGRVYFYAGAAGRGIAEPPAVTLTAPLRVIPGVTPTPRNESALSQTSFGMALAVIDVDRDGFADVIVGAPWEDKVYVYVGSRAGPRDPARQVLAQKEHTWFPQHIVAADFDRDGYGDVALIDMDVHDWGASPGPTLTVHRGSPAGLATAPSLSVRIADVAD